MKSVLLILLPVIILSAVLAGGFSSNIKEPQPAPAPDSLNPVELVAGSPGSPFSSLQITHLAAVSITPAPTTAVTPSPSPSPSITPTGNPAFSPTPSPTPGPTRTPNPTTPPTPPCTINFIPQGSCVNGQIQGSFQSIPGYGFCTPQPTSQPCSQPTVPPVLPTTPICPAGEISGYTGSCCVDGAPLGNHARCCGRSYQESGPGGVLGPVMCDFKPVIYLYPEKPMSVDVNIAVPGEITASIPNYLKGGWKGIWALPDGTLFYQGKIYSELFYETALNTKIIPENGFIVSKSQVKSELFDLGKKLGFNDKESVELVDFWSNKLWNLPSPYILISFYSPQQKQIIDKVTINPKPDVFIQYILYFKPVFIPYWVTPPQIPLTLSRWGFTAVEWGGIIDQ